MEEKRSCGECRNFVQHYIIFKAQFRSTSCGHCLVFRVPSKKGKKFPFSEGCEKWEPIEPRAEQRQRTEEILRDTCERLQRIADVLLSNS